MSQLTLRPPSSLPARLALFGAGLAALFVGGLALGRLLDPAAPGAEASGHGDAMAPHGGGMGHGGDGAMAGEAMPPQGLGVAADGLRLVVDDPQRALGATEPLRFRIVDRQGRAVRGFDELHTKRMHLIVVRRDLTGFQHLHPEMKPDGTWVAPLRLDAAGSYRVFADFGHEGTATTLAGDLSVDGRTRFEPLPAPRPEATSDGGYVVRLVSAPARAGEETQLRFEISRDGHPVAVEPYLGAAGHLVALRQGDLAFLHVHPSEHGEGGGHGGHEGGPVAFGATFPTAGSYRLFLQFKINRRVETVAFTTEVE
jgi:hypothetical protein